MSINNRKQFLDPLKFAFLRLCLEYLWALIIIYRIINDYTAITVDKKFRDFLNHLMTELINNVNPTLIGAMLKHSCAGYRTYTTGSGQKS